MMRATLGAADLAGYLEKLLAVHFPDGYDPGQVLRIAVDQALVRTARCFSAIHLRYYQDQGHATFDHLHGDHMASLLYFAANCASRAGAETLAVRLSYLNKILHGLDLYFTVEMPDVFMVVHPVGTVLGRARYSDFLVVYQNCTVGTVGADVDAYPKFGRGVILYSGSSVIGATTLGRNVIVGANAMVVNTSVPDDSVVVGQFPAHRILPNRQSVEALCFGATAEPRP